MIFTECVYCGEPIIVPLQEEYLGMLKDNKQLVTKEVCEKCGKTNFVEHRRIGGEKPWRRRSEAELMQAIGRTDIQTKVLWVMPVYNYATQQVEVLNVTQKSIQEDLANYRNDEDWGDFTEYDVVVTRTGQTKEDTRYSTMAKPHKPLAPEVQSLWQSVTLDLGKTFEPRDTSAREHNAQTE